MASAKIIILGNSGSGKTEFIRTLTRKESDAERLITAELKHQENSGKGQKKFSESLDFDRLVVRDDLILNLYGVPGERNLTFMWQALAKDVLGFILLVDSSRPETLEDTKAILRLISSFREVPYSIIATKGDLNGALNLEAIRKHLELEPDVNLASCDVRVKEVVKEVVISLLERAKG